MRESRKNFSGGRVRQKMRTRKAILEAAARLLGNGGQVPDLEAVASEALVSRATLYRYFPSLDGLMAEVAADAETRSASDLFAGLEDSSPPGPHGDSRLAADRLERVQSHLHQLSRDHEVQLRVFLRCTMDRALDHIGAASPAAGSSKANADTSVVGKRPRLRQARRLQLISEALEPVRHRFDDRRFERLVLALSMLVGLEPFIALTDVCQLEPARSAEVGAWAVRSLLAGALAEPDRGAGSESSGSVDPPTESPDA